MLAGRGYRRARRPEVRRGSAVDALVHGLVGVAATVAGLLVATEIEDPVKQTVRRWWQSLNRRVR